MGGSIIYLDTFGASGGVGRCTRELLRQLEREAVPTLLCGRSHVVDSFKTYHPATRFLQYANLDRPRFRPGAIAIKLAAKSAANSPRLADTLLKESRKAGLRWDRNSAGPVLVNYPQVLAPPSETGAFCVLLHDLNWREYPGNFPDPELTDRNCRGWVERAAKVITNSECTRDEVIKHYDCAPDKVVAAPLAPFAVKTAYGFDAEKYLKSLGLVAGRFYLYPSVWGLHKGHNTLTAALEQSQESDPVVVTCGQPLEGINSSPNPIAALRRSLADRWATLLAAKKLVIVQGISDGELQALRDACRAYVLPSEYEGYGFPLAEAVYHHRPALVSDIKAHREILDRYPLYQLATWFSPTASESLAVELRRAAPQLVTMPTGWQRSIEATWSWKNTVDRMLQGMSLPAGSGA